MCTYDIKKTHTHFFLMFIVVLFVKDKNWKQPDAQKQKINKLWHIDTMGYWTTVRVHELLLHKT